MTNREYFSKEENKEELAKLFVVDTKDKYFPYKLAFRECISAIHFKTEEEAIEYMINWLDAERK